MEQKIKKGLFAFIFIVLFLPFMEQLWPFINSGGLHGYYSNSPDIGIKFKNWFDGTYQEKKGKFINDHTGFRPDMLTQIAV